MEILGPTLELIASEKAAIMKPKTPHLIGILPKPALRVMKQVARIVGAELHELGKANVAFQDDSLRLDYQSDQISLRAFRPGLMGVHQLRNTALVLKACEILDMRGLKISSGARRSGIKEVHWPGRFQRLKSPSGQTVILDLAHNRGGAGAVRRTFNLLYPGRHATVILGLVKKKEHQEIIDEMGKIAKQFILVPLPTHRTATPEELIENLNFREVPVAGVRSLSEALSTVAASSRSADIIAIVGSHYLVGEYMEKYQQQWHGRRNLNRRVNKK